MARVRWTRDLAWAAATDAGNEHARAAGRTAWSREDARHAAGEFNRLWPLEKDTAWSNPEQVVRRWERR